MGPVGLPGAVSLSRALLSLTRGRRTGVLRVCSELGMCRIAVVEGVPRAASGFGADDEPLGDALVRDGALDTRAHAGALRGVAALPSPVGRWLLDAGLVSRPALELALRRQLRDRVVRALSCSALDYVFEPGPAEVGVPWIEEPMATADLVLCALRASLHAWPEHALGAVVPEGKLTLTQLGLALTATAALWPEEAVARRLLHEGTTLIEVLRAADAGSVDRAACAARALRFVAALSLLSAVTPAGRDAGRCSLLVRKRVQMARDVEAHALLDVPRDASADDARRALRRLAQSVHPDALGPDAPEALRRASSEVLAALAEAERALR
jgi:hypothetical protein